MVANVSILRTCEHYIDPQLKFGHLGFSLEGLTEVSILKYYSVVTQNKSPVLRNEVHEDTHLWELNLASFPTAAGLVP